MAYYQEGPYSQPETDMHLKPMTLAQTTSRASSYDGSYKPLDPSTFTDNELQRLNTRDSNLKKRIRQLRFVSRILSAILAAATVVPLVITLVKFLQTQNKTFNVDGEERTAWSSDTHTWYLYVYLAVSATSFVLDTAIVISYCRGVKQANTTAKYANWFSIGIMVTHLVAWAVSVGIYRYGKEPLANGKFKDLWGWSCSSEAQDIQNQVPNVDYSTFCDVQTTSFYTGIANAATGVLSATIYLLVFLRARSKKRVKAVDEAREPLRQF